jgi:alpha-galactosidase
MNNHLFDETNHIKINRDKLTSLEHTWVSESIGDENGIPKGDMPGDKVVIGLNHIRKARLVFPKLLELLEPVLNESLCCRAVVSVYGGSGVGKSEVASLLSYYLNSLGIGSYTLSGDNYPYRFPRYNDAERLRVFRQHGIKALIMYGLYTDERPSVLKELQKSGNDSNTDYVKKHPWLSVYQNAGRGGLKNYLGSDGEIDFDKLTEIVSQFKNGCSHIFLKRMGREETELWYDSVDFGGKNVLIVEWTHGNNHNLQGIDIPILLNSTPEETLEHRKLRNRDGGADSPFTSMILGIEQEMLNSQASRAKLIVSQSGEILSYGDYIGVMTQGQQ